jgi:segregation and condensation protein B
LSERDSSRPTGELLVPAVGAAIFASDEPVGADEIAEAFGGMPIEEVEGAIRDLQHVLAQTGAGLRVESVAGGYQLSTTPDVGPWVRLFFRQRNRTRLSPAALETLAIVAYRQPVTGPEIQAIRGKDPSGPLKTLVDKKLLRLLGRKKVVGNPLLYGTSKQFLIHFGLNSLEDLPAIEDFEEFVEALATERPELFTEEAASGEPDAGAGDREVAVTVPPEPS